MSSDLVQITLHEHGESIESVWAKAVDAGLYEIASIPLLQLSITAGDIVAVQQSESGLLLEEVVKRGGRWCAIYNWFPVVGGTVGDVTACLMATAKENDLVVTLFAPSVGFAGCAYVAAPISLTPEQLDAIMRNSGAPADLDRALPVALSPSRPSRLAQQARPAAKRAPAAKKRAAKKKPVAKKKPAPKKSAPKKSAKKKPAPKKAKKAAKKKKAKKRR